MKEKKILALSLIVIPLFIYFFPRWVIQTFGAASPWASYLYQYGLGGVVFFVGIYIVLKSEACQLSYHKHRKWFYFLIGGFFYFAIAHWVWIYLALNTATYSTGVN